MCAQGTRAVRESVLSRDAGASLAAAVILIDMMDGDDFEAARHATATFVDGRAVFFHDPQHLAGLALARSLGWQHHVAWDTYLFYSPSAGWEGETPPAPAEWFHALQDREVWEEQASTVSASTAWTGKLAEKSEADPERFRTGDALLAALRQASDGLTSAGGG